MSDFLYDLCGKPFGWIMRLIYDLVDNYALAILLFTIFTKLILFPISYKQQKNSAKMQRFNPKLEKLRKKYKDDPKKMQEEQMKLYQEENINPGASCLPMFLQFFILFGILDVVYKPLSFILKMKDSVISSAFEIVRNINPELAKQGTSLRRELAILSAQHSDASAFQSVLGDNLSAKMTEFYDKFNLFGINLGEVPSWHPDVWNATAIGLFLIPVLSGVLQLALTIYMQIYQKKKNPGMPNMGCMNIMLYAMPIFSVWFAFQVPAGVGFYWVCSSFFSLIQSIGLNCYFTKERIEAICEKENQKNVKKYANGKKSFMQRMMDVQQGNDIMNQREKYIEETKDMSRSELNKYNQQVLKDARKRMAEKYGETYDESDSTEDSGDQK
ncbi:MAG: YidC/Oxa1 family membrane protein insertase [Ruminococcus callidus]|nr:YidC/Oxa1 family membrane protein insertase [Ruminococcus callidus]